MTTSLPLATSTWNDDEIDAGIEVLKSGQTTMGKHVLKFESEFADYIGAKHAVMVNSGSSANLLALAVLKYHSRYRLEPGSEIIVPTVSWATTYYPVNQAGFTLKFVDIDAGSWNLDFEKVVAAIGPATGAILAVNLLGNAHGIDALRQLSEQHGLVLIEDNCESLGAMENGRAAGSFGLMGTYSTFFSHHICTMEGGLITTDDLETYQILVSLRAHGWLRNLPSENFVHPRSNVAFEDLFKFALPGYNVRPLEIEAAIGSIQLGKLPNFVENRRKNAEVFIREMKDLPNVRIQNASVVDASWFGFGMVLEGRLANKRNELVQLLQNHGVECRPIVSGNFLRNPVIDHLDYLIAGEVTVADQLHDNGFFIGNHQVDVTAGLIAATAIIKQFVNDAFDSETR